MMGARDAPGAHAATRACGAPRARPEATRATPVTRAALVVIALIAAIAALLAAGCATTLTRPVEPYTSPVIELAPGAAHESCLPLEAGDRLLFGYQVDPPAAFSIRRRVGTATVSYLLRDPAREEGGIFFVAQAETYCLHWEPEAPDSRWPTLLRFWLRINPQG